MLPPPRSRNAGIAARAHRSAPRRSVSRSSSGGFTEEPPLAAPVLLPEPGVDLLRVRLDPLPRRLRRVHVLPGDQVGDEVLIVVRPLPPLQHRVRGRAALRELRAEDLV